jgi:S-DNA-T family DNA segregation ATPase FtsK/SpoIIIE
MARRKKRDLLDYISLPKIEMEDETKKGIWTIFWIGMGVIGFLGLFDMAGLAGAYLSNFLELFFGLGKWIVPFVLAFIGIALYFDERFEHRSSVFFGIFLFLVSILLFLQLLVSPDAWEESVMTGIGGGYAGMFLAENFIKLLGIYVSILSSIALLFISLMMIFQTSLSHIIGRQSHLAKLFYPLVFIAGKLFGKKGKEADESENDDKEEEIDNDDKADNESEEEDEEEDGEDEGEKDDVDDEEMKNTQDDEDNQLAEMKFEKKTVSSPSQQTAVVNPWKTSGVEIALPLSLLTTKKGKAASGDIKANTEIIKNTLEKFNIPVEMGAVSVGPTVTQFTFKPSEGVKLSKITTLSNDLALALAAHPIRIEAPIPNKSLVGVEVPNQIKAIVGLKEILTGQQFQNKKNNLYIALGNDVAGDPWAYDISKMPHLLVAGATNSGKSVCLNAIIISLMYQNNPDNLKFIMVDPKRVELTVYEGIPYLITPVITDIGSTINALKWCLNEMDRRFELLRSKKHRNIQGYNESSSDKLPYIIFIIDELADLMVAAAKDIEAGVIRLAQMARAVGIHLILATQRPSVDIITGVIKANMPARIAFSVAQGNDSRTILDSLGAEKLLGRGDMLFAAPEMSKPIRLQGAYVSDEEIKKIVKYVIAKSGKPNYIEGVTEHQKVKGMGGYGMNGDNGGGDSDDMLEEAKELVIKNGKASTSMLQRRLRIGYSRAASIIDQLEDLGVVGPANGSKPREILITQEEYDNMAEQSISGVSLHSRKESKAPENYLGEASEFPPVLKDLEEEEEDEEADIDEENTDEVDEEADEDKGEEQDDKKEETEVLSEDDKEDSGDDNADDDFGKYSAK